MTVHEVMGRLEELGTAQNRKVYARHGYGANMFGVSFTGLRKLAKRIKRDHALAQELWATGNEDARMLACMIADPEAMSAADLDSWIADAHNYVLVDLFAASVAAKSPRGRKKVGPWTRSKRDFTGQAGWDLVANLAIQVDNVPDAEFEKHLATIEKRIHAAPNRTRHAMNNALIAIAISRPALQEQALAAAARIGKVEVDHGETGCKTPDATAYIKRALDRKRKPGSSRRTKGS